VPRHRPKGRATYARFLHADFTHRSEPRPGADKKQRLTFPLSSNRKAPAGVRSTGPAVNGDRPAAVASKHRPPEPQWPAPAIPKPMGHGVPVAQAERINPSKGDAVVEWGAGPGRPATYLLVVFVRASRQECGSANLSKRPRFLFRTPTSGDRSSHRPFCVLFCSLSVCRESRTTGSVNPFQLNPHMGGAPIGTIGGACSGLPNAPC
jgi:hypothetical protein